MLVVVLVGQFMIVSAVGSMNVALPAIRDDLGASPAAMQWVLVLYQLGYASLLVTGGRLGDLFGRKRVFIAGLTGFVAASTLAAVAPTPGLLLAARLLQGLCGGITSPQVLAVIQVAVPVHERPKAFAAFGMVSGSAFMLGQVISGGLIRIDVLDLGWRSALLVNLVIGVVAVPAAMRVLPRTAPSRDHRLDFPGMVLATTTGLLVLYPVIQGRAAGWPPYFLGMLAAAVVLGAVFLRLERRLTDRGADPLIDMSLFGERSFRAGLIVAFALSFSTLPTFYVVTLTLQLGFGFDALTAALATAPTPIAVITTSMLSSRLLARYGRGTVAIASLFGISASVVLLLTVTLAPRPLSPLDLVPALLLLGCNNGLGMTSVVNLTLVDVPQARAGSASGVLQTVQQGTSALGVAVAGVIFFGAIGDDTGTDSIVSGLRATLALTVVCSLSVLVLHRLLPPLPRRAEELDLEPDPGSPLKPSAG